MAKSTRELLTECKELLDSVDEVFWSKKINALLDHNPNKLNERSVKQVLSWYGGMGSFNDLIISSFNNHKTDGKNESEINDKLTKVRRQIYEQVKSY